MLKHEVFFVVGAFGHFLFRPSLVLLKFIQIDIAGELLQCAGKRIQTHCLKERPLLLRDSDHHPFVYACKMPAR